MQHSQEVWDACARALREHPVSPTRAARRGRGGANLRLTLAHASTPVRRCEAEGGVVHAAYEGCDGARAKHPLGPAWRASPSPRRNPPH